MASEVQKEGFLVKKGHIRHNWRTRWFVLLKHELMYFRSKGSKEPAGVIPLNGATLICPPFDAAKKPCLLDLTTSKGRRYMIQAPDQLTKEEWKIAIEDCIRKLDPAKANRDMSPTRTLVRAEGFAAINDAFREIVQAMQDPDAGVKLREFKIKGNFPKHFFTGEDVINWLLLWSFSEDRQSATSLASEILQYGFFNAVQLDYKECSFKKINDSTTMKEMVDSPEANYDFVVFSPGESMHLFSSETDDEDSASDSDSDSENDILTSRVFGRTHLNSVQSGDTIILKQGFLLKKTKRRQTWKARKFVLKEKNQFLLYYKGSKGHRALGEIPLKGLTVIEKDVDEDLTSETCPLDKDRCCIVSSPIQLQLKGSRTARKRSRIVLLTATGSRYELEALNSDDRDSWVSYIRVASKLC